MKLYAIKLPDGSIAMDGPYVLATDSEAQGDRMAHARDGDVLIFAQINGIAGARDSEYLRAVKALVAAANATLAANPSDDTMWTLENAVIPFNEPKQGDGVEEFTVSVGGLMKVPAARVVTRMRDKAGELDSRYRLLQNVAGGKADPTDADAAALLRTGADALERLAALRQSPGVAELDAVDLEQFRVPVRAYRHNANHLYEMASDLTPSVSDVYMERIREADRLLAIIDDAARKGVGRG